MIDEILVWTLSKIKSVGTSQTSILSVSKVIYDTIYFIFL